MTWRCYRIHNLKSLFDEWQYQALHKTSPPAPSSSSQCFYSVNVDTDKDIEYSNMAISQHFTQYAALHTNWQHNTQCHKLKI